MALPLKNKTVFITGSSRGIGREIAIKFATSGANIVIAAKTIKEDPALEGSIYATAKDIINFGSQALPIQVDTRH